MGSKKVLRTRRADVNYPTFHICSLPYEILLKIFLYVEDSTQALLSLCITCTKFNNIINKNFLYRSVTFKSAHQFEKFSQYHLPSSKSSLAKKLKLSEPSSKVNYIQAVHIINPPAKDASTFKTSIAGSYDVESVETRGQIVTYSSFVTALQTLLEETYGLKTLKLSEISPQFSLPDEIDNGDSGYFQLLKRTKAKRTLQRLIFQGQSGWSIPFKTSHIISLINVFDTIGDLTLNNFVINDSKLLSISVTKCISINKLTLNSCIYLEQTFNRTSPNKKRLCSPLFANTTILQLQNVLTKQDLSLIDFVKLNGKLQTLILDANSRIFYDYNMETNDKSFNFMKYNNFFKLVCSGQGGYSSLKELVLLDFDLFDCDGHIHHIRENTEEEESDDWIETPTDRFQKFLSYLSQIQNLKIILKEKESLIHTCIRCGIQFQLESDVDPLENSGAKTIITLKDTEWNILLRPLLTGNEKCNVVILDHNLQVIFSRIGDSLTT